MFPAGGWREAFRAHRGEPDPRDISNSRSGNIKRRLSGLFARRGSSEPGEAAAILTHIQRAGKYALIRSDVEDDQDIEECAYLLANEAGGSPRGSPRASPFLAWQRTLPPMPVHSSGMRHKSRLGRAPGLARDQEFADEDEVGYVGPWAWVDSTCFQGFCGFIIFLNAIVIGLETDVQTELWWYVEQAFLAFYAFELSVRLLRFQLVFFWQEGDWTWNCFDFTIVLSGVCDQWIWPSIQVLSGSTNQRSNMGTVFMLMRIGRLFRVVRLFRLVRIVRPLYQLAQGVLDALQAMFWVLVLLVVALYAGAIVCARLFGRVSTRSSDSNAEAFESIEHMFRSVSDSMFALFGTISSWSLSPFNPMFEKIPSIRPLFVLFYVYSAWAVLAVMTGVVSDNMITIREQMMHEDAIREEMRRRQVTDVLRDLFRASDLDGNGTISRSEFDAMLQSQKLRRKISKSNNIRMDDLKELFDLIDHDGSGTITIDEFMKGFKWINEPLGAKSLVKLQEHVMSEMQAIEHTLNTTFGERIDGVHKLVTQPLRKVHAVTEQMQNLDVQLKEQRQRLKPMASSVPSQNMLADTYGRLNKKLQRVLSRIEALEHRASQTHA